MRQSKTAQSTLQRRAQSKTRQQKKTSPELATTLVLERTTQQTGARFALLASVAVPWWSEVRAAGALKRGTGTAGAARSWEPRSAASGAIAAAGFGAEPRKFFWFMEAWNPASVAGLGVQLRSTGRLRGGRQRAGS